MTCVVCKSRTTQPGRPTVTLERDRRTVVFRHVPAVDCSKCGEEYVSEAAAATDTRLAEQAACTGVQVDVQEYVAA